MIVLFILGLLAALVAPRLIGQVGKAKQKSALAQINLLATTLDLLYLDVSRYPTTEEGLKILRDKPDNLPAWSGPYLDKPIPNDPWGRAYIYKSPGEHGPYDLSTLGADGAVGGAGENQDVNNWQATH
jgi:general secretion pathway protein G